MGVGWVLLAKGVSLMDERADLRGETRLEFGDFAPSDMGSGRWDRMAVSVKEVKLGQSAFL